MWRSAARIEHVKPVPARNREPPDLVHRLLTWSAEVLQMSRFAFVSFVTIASLAAACSSSGDHQPTAQEYDDVAQQVGRTTSTGGGGGEVGSLHDAVAISLGTVPLGLSLSLDGHIDGSRLGVDYDYQVTCKDASGTPLATCSAATDRADVAVAWSGTLVLPDLTASVDRHGAWTLTGLQTDRVTLDGDGRFSFDSDVKSIFRAAESTYHLAYDASYDAVVVDKTSGNPIAGTIHYAIAAAHTETAEGTTTTSSFDVDAEVTFTGDGKASLVIDGSERYTIDLATGLVIRI
jgi:hypothetical protein